MPAPKRAAAENDDIRHAARTAQTISSLKTHRKTGYPYPACRVSGCFFALIKAGDEGLSTFPF